jgi:hypothetical protein
LALPVSICGTIAPRTSIDQGNGRKPVVTNKLKVSIPFFSFLNGDILSGDPESPSDPCICAFAVTIHVGYVSICTKTFISQLQKIFESTIDCSSSSWGREGCCEEISRRRENRSSNSNPCIKVQINSILRTEAWCGYLSGPDRKNREWKTRLPPADDSETLETDTRVAICEHHPGTGRVMRRVIEDEVRQSENRRGHNRDMN